MAVRSSHGLTARSKSRGVTTWNGWYSESICISTSSNRQLRSATVSESRSAALGATHRGGNSHSAPRPRSRRSAKWVPEYDTTWLRRKGQYSSPQPVCVRVLRLPLSPSVCLALIEVSSLRKNKVTYILINKVYGHSFIILHNKYYFLGLCDPNQWKNKKQ